MSWTSYAVRQALAQDADAAAVEEFVLAAVRCRAARVAMGAVVQFDCEARLEGLTVA
jgi:hypothetical protein